MLGLGNPGRRYARTRHNVGWRVVESLAERWRAAPGEATEAYRSWRAEARGREVDLLVPLTFVNRSGAALEAWRERHGLEKDGLLVLVDDVYLPVGALRLRGLGSSGGHQGLESIEGTLGTREYARLRIGVGASESARLEEHVLEELPRDEEETLAEALARAADAVECWIGEGLLVAMNRFNRKARKEVEET